MKAKKDEIRVASRWSSSVRITRQLKQKDSRASPPPLETERRRSFYLAGTQPRKHRNLVIF